jgi:DNA-binding NarL/FixJ family response regulator
VLPDLATVALNALWQELPGATLESVRGRGGGRVRSRARHVIIRRLHTAGYKNIHIARFLDLSESAVSDVVRRRS